MSRGEVADLPNRDDLQRMLDRADKRIAELEGAIRRWENATRGPLYATLRLKMGALNEDAS